jgi:hypothetical protein
MKPFRRDLAGREQDECGGKDQRAGEVSETERHRQGVAPGLAQRGRCDLDDPEAECDFWDLARNRISAHAD